MVGDHTAVVRHGAGMGRLVRPALHELLADPLAATLEAGWQLSWLAARRRLNTAADAAATSAVYWAGRLRNGGSAAWFWLTARTDPSARPRLRPPPRALLAFPHPASWRAAAAPLLWAPAGTDAGPGSRRRSHLGSPIGSTL